MERLTYSVAEAADVLGISRASAYNLVRSGEIPSLTLGTRIVIPRHVVADMLRLPQAG